MDWLISFSLLAAGALGLWVVEDSRIWDAFSRDSTAWEPAGILTRLSGQIRVRFSETSVWLDLAESRTEVVEGEAIFTSATGHAKLQLLDGGRDGGSDDTSGPGPTLDILPDSVVVVRAPSASLWRKLPDLELRKGRLRLSMRGRSRILIHSEKKAYELRNEQGAANVGIASYPGEPGELQIQPEDNAHVRWSEEASNPPTQAPATLFEPLAPREAETAKLPESAPQPRIEVLATGASTRLKNESALNWVELKLRWNPIPRARLYTLLLISTDGKIEESHETPVPELKLIVRSLERRSYRILAGLENGETLRSPEYPLNLQISAPTPKLPVEGAPVAAGSQAVLIWEMTALTPGYRIQIAADPEFKYPLLDRIKTVNVQVYFPTQVGRIYWRVRGVSGNSESPWSPTRSIRVTHAN